MGFNGMQWDAMGFDGIQWDAMGCDGMRWDAMGCDGMQWDAMGCDGMRWDAMGCNGMGLLVEHEGEAAPAGLGVPGVGVGERADELGGGVSVEHEGVELAVWVVWL